MSFSKIVLFTILTNITPWSVKKGLGKLKSEQVNLPSYTNIKRHILYGEQNLHNYIIIQMLEKNAFGWSLCDANWKNRR